MNTAQAEQEKTLTTADFAGAAQQPDQEQREANRTAQAQEQRQEQRQSDERQPQVRGAEHLAALFDPDVAGRFRARWD